MLGLHLHLVSRSRLVLSVLLETQTTKYTLVLEHMLPTVVFCTRRDTALTPWPQTGGSSTSLRVSTVTEL